MFKCKVFFFEVEMFAIILNRIVGQDIQFFIFSAKKLFTCFLIRQDFWRSFVRPSNVHRLRPGDIEVIAGIGDSLVAGSGALEDFAIGTFIEARGVSWCAGGEANWRKYFTLPNILKVRSNIFYPFFFINPHK